MYGIVLLGAPGAGKGTQAVLLAKDLRIAHISSGDLFRENIRNQTDLGKLAQQYMDRGELVPDQVTIEMVRDRLSRPDCENGFILDGFPRTIPQADALDALLKELGRCITAVPYIRVRERMLMERLSHRWTCRDCGAVFSYESLPPRAGCKKDVCTGELYQRSDDNPETQARRIRVYEEQTAPLVDYYRGRGVLQEINGEHTIEYVYHLLRNLALNGAECERGRGERRAMIVLKSAQEIAAMREAGRIVATVLAEVKAQVKPGVALIDLDRLAESIIVSCGATPSFKNYQPGGAPYPFPASICASVNDEVVHGIPGSRRLKDGDIIKIDVGAFYKGYHADSAITVGVGKVAERAERLMQVTQECLKQAIAAARSGNRFGDIGAAIQAVAEPKGYSVVREYTSHGVGRELHEGFGLPNVGQPGTGMLLRPGLTIALEPMINEGRFETKVKKDGWTVVTIDGKLSAQFEHTVAITDGEAEILTKLE